MTTAEAVAATETGTAPTVETVSAALADDAATNRRSWRRVARVWQVAFYLALAIIVFILVARDDPWYLYPIVAAIGASYTIFAVSPLLNDAPDWDRYWIHLVIVTAGTVVLLWRDPAVSFVAIVVLTQYAPFTGLGRRGIDILFTVAVLFGLPIAAHDGWTPTERASVSM